MQRSITLKIIRPCDEKISWEELGYLLRGLSLKVCRMSNFCMTHQFLHAQKLETEYLNPQGHLYCYPHLAEEYPEVPTGIVCAAETRARKLFRRHAATVLRSETSLPGREPKHRSFRAVSALCWRITGGINPRKV